MSYLWSFVESSQTAIQTFVANKFSAESRQQVPSPQTFVEEESLLHQRKPPSKVTMSADDNDHSRIERLLDETAPLMTGDEHSSLKELMSIFCTIPLLREDFIAPVVELHEGVRLPPR
jgi:hypothetical protein